MDEAQARQIVADLIDAGRWKDNRHVATDTIRKGVASRLSRDPQLRDDWNIALVEVFLADDVPNIDLFQGIFEVDDVGIWFYDGDGHIDEPIWRQHVIPWSKVGSLVLHQSS
jgi:hypothetical protein